MTWKIETLNAIVDRKLEPLPNDIKARFIWISELICSHGLEKVGEPYVKHLQGILWEMRLKGRDGISRALYMAVRSKRVVVVQVLIKKTQKTPRKEIELALKRAKEIES